MTTMQNQIDLLRKDLDERIPAVWSDEDLRGWVVVGLQRTRTLLKGVREELATRRITSSDGTITVGGQSYDTSQLLITANQSLYTLPPDCIEIRLIQPTASADINQGIRFLPRNLTDSSMQSALMAGTTDGAGITYLYHTLGLTQMVVAPTPTASVPIVLFYTGMSGDYALTDTITDLPDWALSLARVYARYLALRSIGHPDAMSALAEYKEERVEVRSIAAPRNTQEPEYATGVFDLEDIYDVGELLY